MNEPAVAPRFTPLLRPDVAVRRTTSGIWSTLSISDEAAGYDRIAGGYDLLIGNPLYNRLVWGCTTSRYANAARRVLAGAGAAPILDAGCGSLIFTADAYTATPRDRLVLLDRSMVMLQRGQSRLPDGQFIQGDGLSLPFEDRAFGTVMAWGMLHIFGSNAPFLSELERVTAPGGGVALSTLVLSGRKFGDRMLAMLHRRGEVAEPESAGSVSRTFAERFDAEPSELIGNMLFLTGRRRSAFARR